MSGAGADEAAQGPNRSAEPRGGLPRRRLLLAAAGLLPAAGLGGVVWAASRPDAAQPRTTAMREPMARRPVLWQAKISVPRPQVMAAAGGLVCVAGDQGVDWTPSGAREVFEALNARDGRRRWTFTVRTGARGLGVVDPPGLAVGPGYLYAAVDRLYCLRADDGAAVWSDPVPLTANLAAGPGAVYAVQESLSALSSRDGTQLWSDAAEAGAMPAPILTDGIIYMLGSGPQSNDVVAIRATDGTQLWDSPGPGGGWLACDGKTVCAVSGVGPDVQIQGNAGPMPSQLWTYRASDGKPLYRSAANAGYGLAPVMTAGLAFVTTAQDENIPARLHAMDPGDGRTAWTYPVAPVTPAAAHGRIYTASTAGDLIALDAGDGSPLWQCPVRFTVGPVVADSTVYVCDNTTLYAVQA